jgi:hypothetical protein
MREKESLKRKIGELVQAIKLARTPKLNPWVSSWLKIHSILWNKKKKIVTTSETLKQDNRLLP